MYLAIAMNSIDNFDPIICKFNSIITIIVESAGIYTFLIETAITNATWISKLDTRKRTVLNSMKVE